MTLPDATRRVVAAARERGLEINPIVFPEGTKTSADAAAAVGCELSAIAKSIVFMADGRPVVAILGGDRRADTTKLESAVGAANVKRASLDEARAATGFAAGGTPAFGYPSELSVIVDQRLSRHREVWSAAGTPTTVYPIAFDDLVAAASAAIADIAED